MINHKGKTVKKTLKLITASIIAVAATTPALSLEFNSQEAADAYFAAEERAWQEIRETIKEDATDDASLKKAILSIFIMGLKPESSVEGVIAYAQIVVYLIREGDGFF